MLGVLAVALFAAGALVIGERPAFDAGDAAVAAHFDAARTRIQIGCLLVAAAAPCFVGFLATVASLARGHRAAAVAYGCGLIVVALLLADVTALAVGALRPERMASAPELAGALRDVEYLLMATAAPAGAAMLAAFAVLVLRDGVVWPRWVGRLAMIAAVAYALRAGTLFTTAGVFAADGVLGLWVPVIALLGWILAASVVLAASRS